MTDPVTRVNAPAPDGTIVCYGEVLLRLAAPPPTLLLQDSRLDASFCGAETNVAVALSGFGHRCELVSALPANDLGKAARQTIRAFGVGMDAVVAGPGRMGLYFLSPGAMTRPASIIYDRANSAFALTRPDRYDWTRVLDGASWLFVGGITAALGDGPLTALREALATARSMNVRIAFDTNFRPALWVGREREAAVILRELSCQADLVFAGRRAVAMMTGQRFQHDVPAEGFHAAARAMFAIAPGLRHVAASRRELLDAGRQQYTGLLADRDGLSESETRDLVAIVDRIGTGDAYAAGIVHGLIRGLSRDEAVEFATAAAAWCHSVPGDFLRAGVADVESLLRPVSDVRR